MKSKLEAVRKYRLQQADDSLKEAELLYNSGSSFRSVINRSYYAVFYSVLALFTQKGIVRSKHIGVMSAFDQEYIKTGIFSKKMSKIFHQAFHLRQEGDYREFNLIAREDAIEIMEGAAEFVTQIKSFFDGVTTTLIR